MSSVELRRAATPRDGFTLVEMAIASVVITIMSAMIIQSIRQLSVAEWSMREKSKLTSLAERVMGSLESDVGRAVATFDDSTVGRAMLDRLASESGLEQRDARLDGSRLPTRTVYGTFGADPVGTPEAGNILALALRDGHETVTIPGGGTPSLRRIDCVRFVVWFLHEGDETGVDLARWCSVRLARRADIDAIADPVDREAAVQELLARNIAHAWDPRIDAPEGFAVLETEGTVREFSADETVPADEIASESAIAGRRHVGVAANGTRSPRVPWFAEESATFPHGFEIKRDGDGAADLVFVRLVLSSPTARGRDIVATEITRQISFRSE